MSNTLNYFAQPELGTGDNVLTLGGTVNNTGNMKVEGTLLTTNMFLAASAGASTVCNVEIALTVGDGTTRTAQPHMFDVWLSDAVSGAGLTGTTASGTVTAKAASGIVVDTYTAKKALKVQALASGLFTLEITDSAKTAFYVSVQNPNTGVVSTLLLATADYGA